MTSMDRLWESLNGDLDEFSPCPFWFWNDALSDEEIRRQIEEFQQKGVSAFVIHPRMGLPPSIPFLSEAFLHYMETAIRCAAERGMRVVLYDEAMYPSGSAGGRIVQENPDFANRCLRRRLFIGEEKIQAEEALRGAQVISLQAVPISGERADYGRGRVIARPQEAGPGEAVAAFVMEKSGCVIRGIHADQESDLPGAPLYADVLNPEAVQAFLRIVYDTFYQRFGAYFGTTVIAIFTDEPRMFAKKPPKDAQPFSLGLLPFLLEQSFPETDLGLLFEDSGEAQRAKRLYERLLNRRMAESYFAPLSNWCQEHGIALAGHPFRPGDSGFERYFGIPGQDVVWRWVSKENRRGEESVCAKCASDLARHLGRRRVANECFGAFGWNLRAGEMKWLLNWLFLRGTNLILPHAFYYSVREERFKESPPDVGPHHVIWPHYAYFSGYIRRMSRLLTDSRNITNIALLVDDDFIPYRLTAALDDAMIEYNCVAKCLLDDGTARVKDGRLLVGSYAYDTLMMDDTFPVAEETEILTAFLQSGGKILYIPNVHEERYRYALSLSGENLFTYDSIPAFCAAVEKRFPRPLRVEGRQGSLRLSHLARQEGELYLLANEGEGAASARIWLEDGRRLKVYEPFENRWMPIPVDKKTEPAALMVTVEENQLLVLTADDSPAEELPKFRESAPEARLLTRRERRVVQQGEYEATVSLYQSEIPADATAVGLACANREGIFTLRVNGREAGTLFTPPYRFDLTGLRDAVHPGINEWELTVTADYGYVYDSPGQRVLVEPEEVILWTCETMGNP